ncbi:MAG: HAMP domain-containing sensor histidine kinase, partial [Acidobacteria bacterium]|nr:HAMP domain-containing sensor histidine kinase [Acidobacteriota bacterium]
ERVRHIVDIIRTQASFTAGTVERKLVDLPATIRDAVKVVQESLGQRGVAIDVEYTRAPAQILVQESRFQQMLVNLLKNAMEATDERAARLEDDPDWRPRIRVLAYRGKQKNTLVIDVGDNGIGIDPSHFSSVFNAGYTTKKDGTGLGLHSAANFVIGSGGSIQPLSDGIGHGTTLRVTLRVVEEHRQQRSPTGRGE